MAIMKFSTSSTLKTALVLMAVLTMAPASAQSMGGFCTFITWVKNIIGACAVLAILMYVINSFFSKNALFGEIIQNVLIGCLVAVAAVFLVTSTGLTVNCSV